MQVVCVLLVLAGACALSSQAAIADNHHGHYTNDFVVEVDGNVDVADLVAATHGFKVVSQLHTLGDEIYHFVHEEVATRSKRSAEDVVSRLAKDPNVKRVDQQRILRREKRKILHDKQFELPIHTYKDKSVYQRVLYDNSEEGEAGARTGKSGIPEPRWVNQMNFNDPFYRDQWYYDNKGQTGGTPGIDINVIPVWKKGLTGKGVVVTILDDGIDHTHPDLVDNYMPEASADLNSGYGDDDPMPDVSNIENSHGTRCAGEIAAKANNDNCGVGIAYNSGIGGVRMLDGIVTDMLEARAISFQRDLIDIYSASWGPADNGASMEGPGYLCKKALADGVEMGRNGKGSIFVWATGNGGMVDDDCSCDGYVSSIETISIGSMSDEGLSTYFSEVCPSTMAVVPCGGDHTNPDMRRQENPKVKVVTTDLNGDCTLEFQGTSSAAPMAAGAFALVLEANPDLTWRDVQHLVARTARIPNDQEDGWTVNGGGLHVNPKFGFGVIDVGRMVEAAQNWENVRPQKRCEVPPANHAEDIPLTQGLVQSLESTSCHGSESHINRLEHVQIRVKATHQRRGDLTMTLTSPSGTNSTILKPRPLDGSPEGIDFTFLTVHNWGENPVGKWTLELTDVGGGSKREASRGQLLEWSLILWGTLEKEERGQLKSSSAENEAHPAAQSEVSLVMDEEEDSSNNLMIHFNQEDRQLHEHNKVETLIEELEQTIQETHQPSKQGLLRKRTQTQTKPGREGDRKEVQEILQRIDKILDELNELD